MIALADTGPLVALLFRRDAHHAWAAASLQQLVAPLLTCEAVIAEACFLLRGAPDGAAKLLALFDRGVLRAVSINEELGPIGALMHKYRDLPMSFADACLVRLAEIHDASVWTIDSDFRVYRRNARQRIALLSP